MKSRILKIIALTFPLFLGLQFGYGLIVREPYPSFMMPGFSRIDNNTKTYELKDKVYFVEDFKGNTKEYSITFLFQGMSKIAIGRVIDLAFFNSAFEKTYNSKQKKYYEVIKSIIGAENYSKHILAVRNPKMTEEQISIFTKWFFKIIEEKLSKKIKSVKIERVKIVREFRTGNVFSKEIMDYKIIGK